MPNDVNFLADGGEMGALMRAHDWMASPLGRPETWPQSLRSIVGLLLGSKFPMFVAWGPELGFLYNAPYAEILGAKHPAALGARFYDIWAEIWPDISPLIDAAMAGAASFRQDLPLLMNRRGFDEQTWFTFSYSPVRDESGQVAGMFCACQETTDRVLAERRQAEETERQRRMFEQAPGFICTLRGPDHVFDFVNDTYKRLFGDRGFVGKTVRGAFPELAGQGFDRLLDEVYTTGVRHVANAAPLRLRRTPDALEEEERFLDFIYAPITDAAGDVVGIFCEGHDVTDAHRAQEALRELNGTLERRVAEALAERKLLADIVEGTDAFVQVAGLDFRWLAINNAAADEFERIFGVRPRVGDSMLDVLADWPEHRDAVQAVWSRALAGEEFTQVAEFGDPGRARRFYEMKFNSLRGPDGELIGAYQFVHDVTDRLRDQARLRTIFETSHQLLGLLALDGTLLEANATSLAAIAAKVEDVVGKRFWETPWFTGTPGMPEKVKQAFADVAEGRAYREEIAVDLPTGRRSYDFSMHPMRDDRGAIVAVVPEAVETTDRRNAEAALRQAQKMEAVGQLTGGVAHDFNNLLSSVLGNLELLEARLGADERARKLTQAAARSAQRGAKLTQQLLAFARKQHLAPEATDLNRAVRGMTDMLRRTLGGGAVEVKTALAGELWPALVDATQIEVALLNLAINARDAMPLGGTVRIETRNVAAAAASGRDLPGDLVPGDYVVVSVADTGEGMPPEVLAKAFDPFFTTKAAGKGTGLGLSQVYGLARQSGGTARIRSKPGEGTTVEIYLPRAAAAERGGVAAEPSEGAAETSILRPPGTVLVVDDQDDIRELAVAQLEALGRRVVAAADGRLALDLLLAGSSSPVDVLLVDYAMPGMSGTEVIRVARQARPDQPIVLMTGYADAHALGDPLPPGVVLLKKPFRMQELAEALDAAPRAARGADPVGAKVIPLDRTRH